MPQDSSAACACRQSAPLLTSAWPQFNFPKFTFCAAQPGGRLPASRGHFTLAGRRAPKPASCQLRVLRETKLFCNEKILADEFGGRLDLLDQKSYPLPSSAQLIKIRRPFWSKQNSTVSRNLNCQHEVMRAQIFCRWAFGGGQRNRANPEQRAGSQAGGG
jgi:hypothetical protein